MTLAFLTSKIRTQCQAVTCKANYICLFHLIFASLITYVGHKVEMNIISMPCSLYAVMDSGTFWMSVTIIPFFLLWFLFISFLSTFGGRQDNVTDHKYKPSWKWSTINTSFTRHLMLETNNDNMVGFFFKEDKILLAGRWIKQKHFQNTITLSDMKQTKLESQSAVAN